MANWTPEQWGVFFTQLIALVGALGAAGKIYIDYLTKARNAEIKQLKADVAKLKHDRKRDRKRIAQLVKALTDNNIPVPDEETDDEESDET